MLVVAQTWDGQSIDAAEQAIVRIARAATHLTIDVSAPFHGDPAPAGRPGPTDELWNHEVVELFLANGDHYTEIELSPHGHYLVLRLEGRRQPVERLLPMSYKARIDRRRDRWEGLAHLPLDLLPDEPWTSNAYALHGVGAARRYLACWPVPGPEPDFHQLESFRPL